jgi:hypothetical protein
MADPASPTPTAETVLREVAEAVAPLVKLLVHHGVDHPRFAAALKKLFVEAALEELSAQGAGPTLTAIGLRSGLQRRDVKTQLAHRGSPLPPKALTPTLPMQTLARWVADPHYCDPDGAPLALPLRSTDAAQPTFERLADSLSKDVHAQAVLDELIRIGLVRLEGNLARVIVESLVPTRSQEQSLGAMSRSLADHGHAAVANVLAGEKTFLEYSLIADELRPESAEALHRLARKLWRSAYKRTVVEAFDCVERDKALGFDTAHPETRVRFGVYFYSAPVAPAAPKPVTRGDETT